jgi:hypothetical protein
MKKILVFSLAAIALLGLSSFVKTYMASPSVLDMSGYVLHNEKKVEGALVKLIREQCDCK